MPPLRQLYQDRLARLDAEHQLVVATDLTANASDQGELPVLCFTVTAGAWSRPGSRLGGGGAIAASSAHTFPQGSTRSPGRWGGGRADRRDDACRAGCCLRAFDLELAAAASEETCHHAVDPSSVHPWAGVVERCSRPVRWLFGSRREPASGRRSRCRTGALGANWGGRCSSSGSARSGTTENPPRPADRRSRPDT